MAPRNQTAFLHHRYSLQCNITLQGMLVELRSPKDQIISHELANASIAQEGVYICIVREMKTNSEVYRTKITFAIVGKEMFFFFFCVKPRLHGNTYLEPNFMYAIMGNSGLSPDSNPLP